MYIDFHTHAFADKIAGRAMEALSATSGLKPYTDGTLCGLKKKAQGTRYQRGGRTSDCDKAVSAEGCQRLGRGY